MMFSFHHIALSVSNMEKSKRFYNVFGFNVLLDWVSDNKNLSISHLMLDSILLELFCYTEFKKNAEISLDDDLRKIGVKHFALVVDSIEAAKNKVIEAGIVKPEEIEIKKGRTGIIYFFIKDPDNNFVEIVEDKRGRGK